MAESDLRELATTLAERASTEDGEASSRRSAEALMPLVYEQLRRLARGYFRSERRGHTLQPTALVNEAFLRLVDQSRVSWRGRTHFLGVGPRVMRRLLVDHARGLRRLKRGGDRLKVTLDERLVEGRAELGAEHMLALDQALEELAKLDQRQARVVELRYFAGLGVREVAELLRVSERTVKGDWAHARAWLGKQLGSSSGKR